MPTRERPRDRAKRVAQADVARVGEELRRARTAAGLSLRTVGREAAISAAQVWRAERGVLASVRVEQLARIGVVVGLDVRVRAYPAGDPLRDAGQIRVSERLTSHLHPDLEVVSEVGLPIPGDLRAWDLHIRGLSGERSTLPGEIETRFTDAQGQVRRIVLKARDAGEPYVLLVLADTRANRDAVTAAHALLAETFPISTRLALASLGRGEHPGGSALVFV